MARWSVLAWAAAGLVPWVLAPRGGAADCAVASAGGASARAGCDDDADGAAGIASGLLARPGGIERPVLAASDDGCAVAQAGGAVARSGCEADDDVATGVAAVQAPRPRVIAVDHDPAPAPVPVAKPIKAAKPPPDRGPKEPKEPKEEPDPGDGPPPDGDGDVTVELDCEGNPETTAVTNEGSEPIRVLEVDSLVGDTGGEPFARDDLLRPGRTITYETGDAADGRFALGEEIYRDGDPDEGVRIETSGGEFEAFCFVS